MTLGLIARAVSGADVDVITAGDGPAHLNGATIAVPHQHPDHTASVVVQASLLAIGSLTPHQMLSLGRAGAKAAERYLVLEATRAAAVPFLLPPWVASNVRAVGAPVTASAVESLQIARGTDPVPAAPDWFGAIHPHLLRRNAAAAPEAEQSVEDSTLLDLFATPVGSPITRALSRLRGSGTRRKGGGTGAGESAPSTDRRTGQVLARQPTADLTRGGVPVPGARHPEWDAYRAAYREAWCTVYELDPPTGAVPLPPGDNRALSRRLARIGSAAQRRRNLRDGDSLDMSAVIDHVVQRHQGSADPRVFESRSWTARDLGVLILLDATGSTAGLAEGRALFDEQREVAHRLANAFSDLGDRTAVYAFNSRGRHDVRFLRVKDFESRYDDAARARLGAIEPTDFTRLGAAVRHGTRLLGRHAGTSHRLLIVVGDGLPFDDGYEDRYAREDSRLALREALATGVGCVSIGVGTSLDPRVVDEVWGEVVHLHLAGPAELEQQVHEAFGGALRLAVARRRERR